MHVLPSQAVPASHGCCVQGPLQSPPFGTMGTHVPVFAAVSVILQADGGLQTAHPPVAVNPHAAPAATMENASHFFVVRLQ